MENLGLGEQIKKYRKLKKLSQQRLADTLGVDQSTVSYWEKNKKIPDVEMLNKLADFFGISLDILVRARNHTAHNFSHEQENFVREVQRSFSITPEELKRNFSLIVDGRPATDEEIEDAIRYIAIQRMMKENKEKKD